MLRTRWLGLGLEAKGCRGRVLVRSWRFRWWVVLLMVLSVFGCSLLDSGYVVNHDGHYFAGDRCALGLAEVRVFLEDPYPRERDEAYFDVASWPAVVMEPGVREVELFAQGQPGVSVVFDDGQRPYSTKTLIVMRDVRGYWSEVWGISLEELGEDMVNGVSWEEYWERPDGDYGC